MIKLKAAKNNKRLTEYDDFKEYVIDANISVKKVKNQIVFGEKIDGTQKDLNDRMLYHYI
jgi:hypothetical protein